MRTAVLLAVLVILGIGIALACDGDGCEVVCEQTVNNYETKNVQQVTNNECDNEYHFFKAYIGGNQNLVQITDNIHVEAQVRYFPDQNSQKDNLFAGLVLTNAKPIINLAK